jgi:hypothetical protein
VGSSTRTSEVQSNAGPRLGPAFVSDGRYGDGETSLDGDMGLSDAIGDGDVSGTSSDGSGDEPGWQAIAKAATAARAMVNTVRRIMEGPLLGAGIVVLP